MGVSPGKVLSPSRQRRERKRASWPANGLSSEDLPDTARRASQLQQNPPGNGMLHVGRPPGDAEDARNAAGDSQRGKTQARPLVGGEGPGHDFVGEDVLADSMGGPAEDRQDPPGTRHPVKGSPWGARLPKRIRHQYASGILKVDQDFQPGDPALGILSRGDRQGEPISLQGNLERAKPGTESPRHKHRFRRLGEQGVRGSGVNVGKKAEGPQALEGLLWQAVACRACRYDP